MRRGVQYGLRHNFGRIHRLWQLRLMIQVVFRMLDEQRVDARRLDEGHRDRCALVGEFDA